MNIYDDPSREKMGFSGRHIYKEDGGYYHIDVSAGSHSRGDAPKGMVVCLNLVIWPRIYTSYYITKRETCKEIIEKVNTGVLEDDYFLKLCIAVIPTTRLMQACFEAGKTLGQEETQNSIKKALGID